MTVHSEDYPSLRSNLSYLTTSWSRHVDIDPTEEPEDPTGTQMASEASHIIP